VPMDEKPVARHWQSQWHPFLNLVYLNSRS
jgi:hypothetical protein